MENMVINTETVVCRLKEVRIGLGLTQRQVAEGADINVRTLINIEKGRAIPNLLYAMKIAKFLGMRVEEVFEYR
ncbi:DNA-binding helix-turn-helix protein [Catonella morbi ATCC 51271]|uniref:DNA-binding helix-turn-helix protein n=1 Tax=Catonella morbi ATCC 51271 TaxID=592026 RepID=V2Z680_9FIRM|nr:helix-turn-helix domain-containing protein [Catonella morbi]ESL02440.1 DNA-binding helix-turn-helix protein [Catonella morbi ATCC 51271]